MKHAALFLGAAPLYESLAGLLLYFLLLYALALLINRRVERPLQRLIDPRKEAAA